jgi:preprotein translocase subunit SecG
MALIGIVLLVLLVISAILLVLLILVQDEQGEGIAGFFSGASTSAFGSRTGNVLTRFTTAIAAVFLFCCLALAWVNRSGDVGNVVGKAREQALSGDTAQWWVESSAAPESGAAQDTGGVSAGAAPAAEAPSAGGQ